MNCSSYFTKEKISTVNIAKITKAATQPSSSNISTVIPSVSNSTQTENTQGDFVLVDGLSKLDVSTISQNTTIINTSSEDCYIDSNYTLGSMSGVSHNSNGSRKNNVDSGVIVMDHEEITLTPNDASQTIFVDTNSKVLLCWDPNVVCGG